MTLSAVHFRHAALLGTILLYSTSVFAQGCVQCRDNTAATSPATQHAYRRAIAMLGCTGAALFSGTVMLLKKLE